MASSPLDNLAISETGFVFDPQSGATFNVNATGLLVLRGLRDGKPAESISSDLQRAFDATPDEVSEHIAEFTQLLRQFGLLSDGSTEE